MKTVLNSFMYLRELLCHVKVFVQLGQNYKEFGLFPTSSKSVHHSHKVQCVHGMNPISWDILVEFRMDQFFVLGQTVPKAVKCELKPIIRGKQARWSFQQYGKGIQFRKGLEKKIDKRFKIQTILCTLHIREEFNICPCLLDIHCNHIVLLDQG